MTNTIPNTTMAIRPDRRWLTKQYLVLGTITALIAVVVALVHLILTMALTEADRGGLPVLIWSIAGALILVMWSIAVPISILWHRNLEYAVEPERIVIRKGILTKTQQNIPLDMITDFRLRRSLFDRWLDIGSIQIQTAGQSVTATGYEGSMAGLQDWATLHDDLRGRIRRLDRPHDEKDADLASILEEVKGIRRALEASR